MRANLSGELAGEFRRTCVVGGGVGTATTIDASKERAVLGAGRPAPAPRRSHPNRNAHVKIPNFCIFGAHKGAKKVTSPPPKDVKYNTSFHFPPVFLSPPATPPSPAARPRRSHPCAKSGPVVAPLSVSTSVVGCRLKPRIGGFFLLFSPPSIRPRRRLIRPLPVAPPSAPLRRRRTPPPAAGHTSWFYRP